MIKKIFYYLFLLSGILMLSSCAREQPVLNLQNQPASQQLTTEQVKKCIEMAGTGRGWQMHEVKPGLIDGVISRGGHYAEISIPYSNKGYSINYQTSQNLMAKDGSVHRNYNKWIKLLNKDIQSNLLIEQKKGLAK